MASDTPEMPDIPELPDAPTPDPPEPSDGPPRPDIPELPDTPPTPDLPEPSDAPPTPDAGTWVRSIALFLTGQTVSLLGSSLVQYAVLWHLTLTTRSGSVLMLSILFGFLPQAVVSVFGGVWADRYPRKYLIMGADGAIAAATAALAVLILAGHQEIWLVYAALTIRSIGAGIQTPAVSAVVPQLVPTARLIRVNGINSSIQSGIMLLSPALAAWLYASFDLVSIFLVDVATAAIGIGILAALRVPRLPATERVGYFDDLRRGMSYVAGHRVVRRVLVFYAIVFVLIVPTSYLTPLMVVRTFGPEVWKLTVSELSFSIGMILGGAVLAAWGGLRDRMSMIGLSAVVLGVLAVGLGFSTNLWVYFALMALSGLCSPFFSTSSITLLQELTDPAVQGRVFGLVGIVMAVAMPAGMVVFGPLADTFTVESLLVVSGVLAAACGLVARLGRPPTANRPGGGDRLADDRNGLAADDGAERNGARPAGRSDGDGTEPTDGGADVPGTGASGPAPAGS